MLHFYIKIDSNITGMLQMAWQLPGRQLYDVFCKHKNKTKSVNIINYCLLTLPYQFENCSDLGFNELLNFFFSKSNI